MTGLAAVAPQSGAEWAAGAEHVFGTARVTDRDAVRIAGLIDDGFLVEVGWDAATALLSPAGGPSVAGAVGVPSVGLRGDGYQSRRGLRGVSSSAD